MTTDIADRVCGLAAGVFDVSIEHVTPASTSDDIESWDSLALLNLIVALEDEFSVQLDPSDIEEMKSIGDIADLVERRRG